MNTELTIGLPTFLTLLRLILSPLMLPVLLVYLLPYNSLYINSGLALLFLAFGATDFFDGYLARRLKQETMLGRILDPIADKFLLYATLVALLAAGKIYFYWVIIFIGREFFIMALRLIGLEHNITVHVSLLGKLKTVIQIACLGFLILNPYQHHGLSGAWYWNILEISLLVSALGLTLYSAWHYYVNFVLQWRKRFKDATHAAQ